MPRASWKGFLRLSLVSCPVYLSPATTRTKSVRLRQVWVPRVGSRDDEQTDEADQAEDRPQRWSGHARPPGEVDDELEPGPDQELAPATPIALRPYDPHTGEAIDRDEVRKGYEYERGQFVTFTPAELEALDVESSRTIDLTRPLSCAPRSTRSTSTPRTICIRMALWRLNPTG